MFTAAEQKLKEADQLIRQEIADYINRNHPLQFAVKFLLAARADVAHAQEALQDYEETRK